MLIALLAVLGVDLIVIAVLLAAVLWRRRWVMRRPGAFRGAIRVADGEIEGLAPKGLALGIDADQKYEEVSARLEHGDSVVLYTDGVIEARAASELYGVDRLDALLARRRTRAAEDIAASVIESARRFTGGDLFDDCAVVVVKRPA